MTRKNPAKKAKKKQKTRVVYRDRKEKNPFEETNEMVKGAMGLTAGRGMMSLTGAMLSAAMPKK